MLELKDFEAAADRLKNVIHNIPLSTSATFSAMTGAEVYLKYENQQKTGSFKVRGAYNKIMKRYAEGDLHVLPQLIIEPIQKLKIEGLGNHNPRLHTDEVLIALSISAATNPVAELALAQLPKLSGCEVHSSVMLAQVDTGVFKKLGMNLTCEPHYQTKKLYHK